MKIQVSEGLCNRLLKALEEKAQRDADATSGQFKIDVTETQAWRDYLELRHVISRIRAEPRKDSGQYSGRRNRN